MFLVLHSSLWLLGVLSLGLALLLWIRPFWLQDLQADLLEWAQAHPALEWLVPQEDTHKRAVAMDLQTLPAPQAAVANWLAQKYRVAPEPMAALVFEAHALSKKHKMPAHLILGVMAIESGFHPYVQSAAGAQGLMQVMTGIHAKRYEVYGGTRAAFDPVANMRVGVHVLADCIRLKGGLHEGLLYYLGGNNVTDDGGYVAKVLAEQERMDAVAGGATVPLS